MSRSVFAILISCLCAAACDSGSDAVRETPDPGIEIQNSSEPGATPQPGGVVSPPAEAPAIADTANALCGAPLDTNRDGLVQEAEYFSFSGFAFDNWDATDDGQVVPAEFRRCWTALGWGSGEAAFQAFDDDGNRRLEKEEFFSREEFEVWDENNDGALSPDELS